MSNDLNQCQFIGRLGRDVEMRVTPTNDPVANFSIACGWKTKDKEGVEWVPVVVFGKQAEVCSQYLAKGSQVFVQGRMRTEKYVKDGIDRISVKIVADKIQFLGSKTDKPPAEQESTPAPIGEGFDSLEDGRPF